MTNTMATGINTQEQNYAGFANRFIAALIDGFCAPIAVKLALVLIFLPIKMVHSNWARPQDSVLSIFGGS
jgi:uncharacterized RDD family membrane protein YckC